MKKNNIPYHKYEDTKYKISFEEYYAYVAEIPQMKYITLYKEGCEFIYVDGIYKKRNNFKEKKFLLSECQIVEVEPYIPPIPPKETGRNIFELNELKKYLEARLDRELGMINNKMYVPLIHTYFEEILKQFNCFGNMFSQYEWRNILDEFSDDEEFNSKLDAVHLKIKKEQKIKKEKYKKIFEKI